MKRIIFGTVVLLSLLTFGCDVQSGITKRSVEKYEPTPTPQKVVVVEEKIDPADVVTVDVNTEGPKITFITTESKTTADCTKYNRVTINDNGKTFDVKGICKQIMVNGDGNKITASAVSEIMFNGENNSVTYTKFPNGKKPIVTDNSSGNTTEKVTAAPVQKPAR